MTDLKYNKLVTKIFWFALPLVIGLLTFLVANTYFVKEEVAKVVVKNEAVVELQNKMWVVLQDNNKMLQNKADKQENMDAHKIMFMKLDLLQQKVDKIYIKDVRYGMGVKKNDTLNIYNIPYKPVNDLVWQQK